jgi:signal transduction histidine kinase
MNASATIQTRQAELEATHAAVSIEIDDGALIAQIADDGLGGASTTAGSGLRGLADRLDVLGGTLSIASPRGGPTIIRARAPLHRPA